MTSGGDAEILMKNIDVFCDPECEHLNIKEKDQKKMSKEKHKCEKYDVFLKHEFFHPHIAKSKICISQEFIKIKDMAIQKWLDK